MLCVVGLLLIESSFLFKGHFTALLPNGVMSMPVALECL